MSSDSPSYDVVGIGNAIVDVLGEVDDEFIAEYDLAKGSMALIDEERMRALYDAFPPAEEHSGGSAANTMVGAAALGSVAGYIGKVRDDQIGEIFAHDITASGVEFGVTPSPEGPPSGRCLIAVTPDAERTMNTFLGASVELAPEDIDHDMVAASEILYLEGYLWDPPSAKAAMRAAVETAKQAGRRVALSLSDSFCVDRHREEFQELVAHSVDLLFANEDEARALFECDTHAEAILILDGACEVAAVTRGSRGCTVLSGREPVEVPAHQVTKKVDTTGAGDLFAAGFLHAFAGGAEPELAAQVGSIAAAEVITHIGARPATDLRDLVLEHLGATAADLL